ncbi:hypothetical protein B9Z55_028065 [Caenorhabditis nigoni]|uniref:Ubiquitin-like domain-containing protein n=2 Tax=Caenorhabditis nigoni TaxID=1611254 RepID=A0A2G5SDP4_9PELO|nr:hypothetical protein B9Z55_028065 [Caenorhabditis nigoni]
MSTPVPSPMDPLNRIIINVEGLGNFAEKYLFHPDLSIAKLLIRVACDLGRPLEHLCFMFNGIVIEGTETPNELGIKYDDEIEVILIYKRPVAIK